MKLSTLYAGQYANDTKLFLDDSATSLNYALSTQSEFYKMSGLKISIDKTTAIGNMAIGSMAGSLFTLCSDLTVDCCITQTLMYLELKTGKSKMTDLKLSLSHHIHHVV